MKTDDSMRKSVPLLCKHRDKAANLICMCKTKTLKWKQNWATATEVGIHELRITTRNFHLITKFVELIKVLIDSV